MTITQQSLIDERLSIPHAQKIYRGTRWHDEHVYHDEGTLIIQVWPTDTSHYVHYSLHPRYDLANHSPDGFNWGFHGSGPSQTALAILADALGDDKRALELYQSFKCKVIARLPTGRDFDLYYPEIARAVQEIEATRKRPL